MINLGKSEFKLPVDFFEWISKTSHYPLVRFYIGSMSSNMDIFALATLFDKSRNVQKTIEEELEKQKELLSLVNLSESNELREVTLSSCLRHQQPANGFMMTNYLDKISIRLQLVLEGSGSYENEAFGKLDFKPGDILLFGQKSFGQNTKLVLSSPRCTQLVSVWAKPDTRRNWSIFANFKNAAL